MNQFGLRLQERQHGDGHSGEVFAVAYSSDGAFALSGGWDGSLRLWETSSGVLVSSLEASHKPLSACAFAPDDKHWLAGSMEGLLSSWDVAGHQPIYNFVAHTRPISAIRFSPDGKVLATTSWDRQIGVRKVGKEREAKLLTGHRDIVAGCRFSPDGKHLLSWSYDGSLILWDAEFGQQVWALPGHDDRILTAALSPDGRLAASGSRDGVLKLWDIGFRGEAGGLPQTGELVGCFFLLDGESLITVTGAGVLTLLAVPTFEVKAELETGCKVLAAELSPPSSQLALGGDDGRVHFVAIDGLEDAELIVNTTPTTRQTATVLDKFFGKTRTTRVFAFTCPACRIEADLPALPSESFPCPRCGRSLWTAAASRQLQRL